MKSTSTCSCMSVRPSRSAAIGPVTVSIGSFTWPEARAPPINAAAPASHSRRDNIPRPLASLMRVDLSEVARRCQVPRLPCEDNARMRYTALVLVAAAALSSLASGASQSPTGPMNVVVLVIDDIRRDSIGAAGNGVVRTPHIDNLAAQGIRVRQARVTTAICMTSRASLLTGQYTSRHGIDRFGKQLAPDVFRQTYPGVLRAAGYWTGYVGKYDVG